MTAAVIITEGVRQIILTPETPEERAMLGLISSDDSVEVLSTTGTFYDRDASVKPFGAKVKTCRGGYLRAWQHDESRILVFRAKEAGQ